MPIAPSQQESERPTYQIMITHYLYELDDTQMVLMRVTRPIAVSVTIAVFHTAWEALEAADIINSQKHGNFILREAFPLFRLE